MKNGQTGHGHINNLNAALKSQQKNLGMKRASSLGRGLRYVNAHGNLTFELWIILHKGDCGTRTHRSQYLRAINDLYGKTRNMV